MVEVKRDYNGGRINEESCGKQKRKRKVVWNGKKEERKQASNIENDKRCKIIQRLDRR